MVSAGRRLTMRKSPNDLRYRGGVKYRVEEGLSGGKQEAGRLDRLER